MRLFAVLHLTATLTRTDSLTLASVSGDWRSAPGPLTLVNVSGSDRQLASEAVDSDTPPMEGIRFDNVTETYCRHLNRTGVKRKKTKQLLFVQSGPHMGSSLVHEFMSLFSGATLLCRGVQGLHMEWTEGLEPSQPGIRQDLIDRSWAQYLKVRDPRAFAGPPPVALHPLEKSLEPYVVYDGRPVLVLKDPVSVFWTAPIADHFKHRVRFLVLVREPYTYAQVVKNRYFGPPVREREGYEAAGVMASSILMLAAQASVWPQSFLLHYEEFAENPRETFSRLRRWFPDIGTEQADPSTVTIAVHGKLSAITNMNQHYLKLLRQENRDILTKKFLPMNSTIARLGYSIDTDQ